MLSFTYPAKLFYLNVTQELITKQISQHISILLNFRIEVLSLPQFND